MAPVTLADLLLCARALLPVAPERRSKDCATLFDRAGKAQLFRLRAGRSHPDFGDGSLGSAVLCAGSVPRSPSIMTDGYLECLSIVVAQIRRGTAVSRNRSVIHM